MKTKVLVIFLMIFASSSFLFASLMTLDTAMQMEGVSRVVNYAGIVRGATQRLVKLEICEMPNDELIDYLESILEDLRFGNGGTYDLRTLDDEEYNVELDILYEKWVELQAEILLTRQNGFEESEIIDVSEEHFRIANNTVFLAENYGENIAENLGNIKQLLSFTAIVLVFTSSVIIYNIIQLKNEANKLRISAHMDFATSLPNKSRCEILFEEYGILNPTTQYGMIMFDLNNLKVVNDSLGHSFGDELIESFANILKANAFQSFFTGRFGGDEFIVIFKDIEEKIIQNHIALIKEEVNIYNSSHASDQFPISFAAGYAWTYNVNDMTMDTLCSTADKNMYIDKMTSKNVLQNI